jgi:hypothetical protein
LIVLTIPAKIANYKYLLPGLYRVVKTNKDNGVVIRLRSTRVSRPGWSLALFALLLQTLIPFSQAIPVTIVSGPAQSTFSLHCLTMVDSQPAAVDDAPASEKASCPICQVFAIGKSQSSYVFQPALPLLLFIGWQPPAAAIPFSEACFLTAFQARAPPVDC